MNAEHARPMMAYVALCLAASYVLGNGVVGSSSTTGALDIARTGKPVLVVAQSLTLLAGEGAVAVGVNLVSGPVQNVVTAAGRVGISDPVRRVTNTVAATAEVRQPTHVGTAPTLSPTPTSPAPTSHTPAVTSGKAAAAERKNVRKAERAASRSAGSPKSDHPAKRKPAKRSK